MTVTNVRTISPHELARRRQEGKVVELIDVRTPVEYAEIHVEGARLMPLDSLDPEALAAGRNGEPLYVICRSGSRAAKAYEALQAAGVENVYSVEGGTMAWERAGLPVVRGRRVISLERQVRIAAGLLVVLGAALGWLVHPGFLALPAFVGAGLVFAGLTDTCGM
ncbi:MAG TPA: rhodanese-like domain-containing protein, partial [Planctomycetaceae bacterium]